MSIRKHANELKVHEKTVRTAIKQDLGPDLNPLNYTMGFFLKTTQMQLAIQILVHLRLLLRRNGKKAFILKPCKLFQKCVDTIIEKK